MRVFKDYATVNEKILEGYTVAEVLTGVNKEDTGVMIKFERTIDNVTIGIDIIYDPEYVDGATEFMISNEYVKYIDYVQPERAKESKENIDVQN